MVKDTLGLMTAENKAAGFWSYVHADDTSENGRILRLSELIKEQYALLTGVDLKIFVDRDIEWGQEWKRRIDESLQVTTFFIPILTPRYFLSEACRKEFLDFVGAAKALGVSEYLLSLVYVSIADLKPESVDVVKSTAASMQYINWNEVRNLDETDARFRAMVEKVVQTLIKISTKVDGLAAEQVGENRTSAALEISPGRSTAGAPNLGTVLPDDQENPEDQDELPGLLDNLDAFDTLSTAWQKTISEFKPTMEGITNIVSDAAPKLGRQDKPPSYKLTIARKLAVDLDPSVERTSQLSADYVRLLFRIDPVLRALFTHATENADTDGPQADQNQAAIDGARTAIRELSSRSAQMAESISEAITSMRGARQLSRDLNRRLTKLEASLQSIVDAQTIISSWETLVDNG